MLLGLGRGPPGRGPPPRVRSAGRGAPGPAGPAAAWPGGVRGVAPMPVAVELKGLLPGRGPGRGPDRWPGVVGAPGRAPAEPGRGTDGRGPGAGSRVPGSAGPAGAGRVWPPLPWSGPPSLVNGSLGNGAGETCGSGVATGFGATGGAAGGCGVRAPAPADPGPAAADPAPFCAGADVSGTVAARPLAARRSTGAAAAAPSPDAFACAANSSFSLRTTGASIVEDADRTNSPISWSLAITALLSTPNSFASSYTRTFATALPLLDPGFRACQPTGAARAPSGVSLCCSSPHAHRALIASQPSFVRCLRLWAPSGTPRPCLSAGLPTGEGPAETPCGAGLVPSMPGSGAGTHPGQAAGRRRREQSRPLPPPRGSIQT